MQELIVVGGGLVGSLLSIYLARLGYKVGLYERSADCREVGRTSYRSINLTLCERGFRALERAGAADSVRRISVPVQGRVIHGSDGALTRQPYGNNGEAIHSVSRNRLNAVLLEHAEAQPGIDLHFNQECVGLDLRSTTLRFRHRVSGAETTRRAAYVFGADGAFSPIRYDCQRRVRFDYSQVYSAQGYKELAMPAGAAGEWPLGPDALHVWPRGHYMLIAFPNTDHTFTCSLHLPYEGHPSHESVRSGSDVLRLFRDSFPDVLDLIPGLSSEYLANPVNAMITVRCFPWVFEDRVILVGDAAHAIFPSYGQGANAGFEDCLVLSQCLERHGHAWSAALAEYQALRKPSADAIADLSERHFHELRDQIGDPRFLLRKEIERRVNRLYPEQFKDLYSMVSFTTMSYVEAVATSQEQDALVDGIMNIRGCQETLRSGGLDGAIHELMKQRQRPGRRHGDTEVERGE